MLRIPIQSLFTGNTGDDTATLPPCPLITLHHRTGVEIGEAGTERSASFSHDEKTEELLFCFVLCPGHVVLLNDSGSSRCPSNPTCIVSTWSIQEVIVGAHWEGHTAH